MSKTNVPEQELFTVHPRMAKHLVGHKKEFENFKKLKATGTFPHAWLISGPRGIGKSTFAWKMLESLLVQTNRSKVEDEKTRFEIQSLSAPGLFLCERSYDEKTKRLKKFITVDEVRRLKSFFSLSSADGNWRVAIIDSGDELNNSASNALLKILEEPPIRSVIIIVSHMPSAVSSTVKSRCRSIKLRPLNSEQIGEILSAFDININELSNEDRIYFNILTDGSAGKAVAIIKNEMIKKYRSCIFIMSQFPKFDRVKILKLTALADRDPETFKTICSIILKILSRIALISVSNKNTFSTKEELNLISNLLNCKNLASTCANLYSELSKSFAICEELNLDQSNELINAFCLIEKKLLESCNE